MSNPRTLTALCAVAVAGGSLAACQAYDMDPVVPTAPVVKLQSKVIQGMQKPPKVMLALDKSGSMQLTPESDSSWGCCQSVDRFNQCIGYSPTGSCKWNSLKSLLIDSNKFIDQMRRVARLGLAIFPALSIPANDSCAGGAIYVSVADQPDVNTSDIRNTLTSVAPTGGTPSGQLLRGIANDEAFAKEEPQTQRYVILLTDGMPNCNPNISQSACKACTNGGGDPRSMCGDPKYCLDEDNLVGAVTALHGKGIDTFVIGFGSGTSGSDAGRVLNSAAEAGGQAQAGGAATKYYQANNEADLKRVFDAIIQAIVSCTFALEKPVSKAELLEVSVADATLGVEKRLVAGQDWHFETDSGKGCDSNCPVCWSVPGTNNKQCVAVPQKVTLDGDWCTTIQTTTDANRYTVKFYNVESL